MSLAPSIDELKKKKKDVIKPITDVDGGSTMKDISPDGVVKWRLIGAGGAGKSAALRYSSINPYGTRITTIDTSGITKSVDGVEVVRIKNLNGSGKHRKENIKPIMDFVSDYVTNSTFDEVNVLIHSFSGGSGSVVGPLLTKEIIRQNKIPIVIGIIDTDSEIDTINALNTLSSIDKIAKEKNAYIPVILFDNEHGRKTVDNGIDQTVRYISNLLDKPYIGLDKEDRIKFFNPTKFQDVVPGVKMINISQRPDGEWENIGIVVAEDSYEVIDATLIVSKVDEYLKLAKKCLVTYRGYYEDDDINHIASIGYHVPQSLVDKLNSRVHSFKTTSRPSATSFDSEYDIGEDDGGIIL